MKWPEWPPTASRRRQVPYAPEPAHGTGVFERPGRRRYNRQGSPPVKPANRRQNLPTPSAQPSITLCGAAFANGQIPEISRRGRDRRREVYHATNSSSPAASYIRAQFTLSPMAIARARQVCDHIRRGNPGRAVVVRCGPRLSLVAQPCLVRFPVRDHRLVHTHRVLRRRLWWCLRCVRRLPGSVRGLRRSVLGDRR